MSMGVIAPLLGGSTQVCIVGVFLLTLIPKKEESKSKPKAKNGTVSNGRKGARLETRKILLAINFELTQYCSID